MAVIELFTGSILTFTQTASANIKGCVAESMLQFTQSVNVNLHSEIVNDRISFVQTVRVTKVLGLQATNTLTLTQSCHPRTIVLEAYNGFIFWQEVGIPLHHLTTHNLVFNQSAVGIAAKSGKNILSLSQQANVEVIKVLPVSQTFVMASMATAWKVDKFWIAVPSLMYSAGPLVVFRHQGKEFEFQAPEMGNRETVEYVRISRESIGGDRQVFRDPNWPFIQKLFINFNVCTEAEIFKIRNLIKASLGSFLEYRDHNAKWWDAFITNPQTAISQSGRMGYEVALELEATEQ